MKETLVHLLKRTWKHYPAAGFNPFRNSKMTVGSSSSVPGSSTKNNTILYFSYGSNLSSDRIRHSNKSAVFKSIGLLKVSRF